VIGVTQGNYEYKIVAGKLQKMELLIDLVVDGGKGKDKFVPVL
jgi:hypothetical protein